MRSCEVISYINNSFVFCIGRVLIGQWVSEPFRASSYFPICDIALRLSDLLIEKFSRGTSFAFSLYPFFYRLYNEFFFKRCKREVREKASKDQPTEQRKFQCQDAH
jgi:hypothetical protein